MPLSQQFPLSFFFKSFTHRSLKRSSSSRHQVNWRLSRGASFKSAAAKWMRSPQAPHCGPAPPSDQHHDVSVVVEMASLFFLSSDLAYHDRNKTMGCQRAMAQPPLRVRRRAVLRSRNKYAAFRGHYKEGTAYSQCRPRTGGLKDAAAGYAHWSHGQYRGRQSARENPDCWEEWDLHFGAEDRQG